MAGALWPGEHHAAIALPDARRGEQVTMPPPLAFDRAEQQRRASRAEKELGTLGKVNPLALEEYAALEERYRFLSTQLEDVKASKRDLLVFEGGVLEEAWELVEHGLMDLDDFKRFTFTNVAGLHTGNNPQFFEGTVVEQAVAELLDR